MLTRRTPLFVVAALALVAYSPVRAQEEQQQAPQQTIIAVLEAQGNYSTLLSAIRAAGLAETLAAEGTYTIFAPTDEAFAALPEGKLEELTANPEALKQLLSFHVTSDPVMIAEITEPVSVTTLEGSTLQIVKDGETIRIQAPAPAAEVRTGEEAPVPISAMVVVPETAASNGRVFSIDRVLIIES